MGLRVYSFVYRTDLASAAAEALGGGSSGSAPAPRISSRASDKQDLTAHFILGKNRATVQLLGNEKLESVLCGRSDAVALQHLTRLQNTRGATQYNLRSFDLRVN